MKKIISFILICVIAVSSAGFVAADFEDILPDAPYGEEISVVTGLGIMEPTAENEFSPKDYVTRAEFIKIIASLTGVSNTDSVFARRVFIDVNQEHWYAKEITLAYDLGLIGGDELSAFNPDRYVSYNEAVKILIHILGYDLHAQRKGGYPSGYMLYATSLGMSKGISLAGDAYISRGEIAMLIVNSFDIKLFPDLNDETLLSGKLKLSKVKGRVTATSKTSLTGEDSVYDDEVDIEFIGYKTDTKYDELLGYEVVCYYEDNYGQRDVRYIYETDKNEATLITNEEITDVDGGKISYLENDNVEDISIPKDAYVIYNHTAYTNYPNDVFDIAGGEISLLDNDGDGNVDVAFVYEYTNYLLVGVNSVNNELYAGGEVLPIDEKKKDEVIDADTGVVVPLEEMEAGELISVFYNPESGSRTVYINHKTAQGVLEQIADDVITIGAKKYKCTIEFDILKEKLGTDIRVYLDYRGIAVMLDEDYRSKSQYGFILSADSKSRFGSQIKIKMYTESAKREIFDVAEKVKLDSEMVESDELITKLNSRATDFGSPDGISMLVRYKMNAEGELSEIDTPSYTESKEEETSLRLSTYYPNDAWINVHYRESSNIFEGEFSVVPDVKIFIVPELLEARQSDDEQYANKFGIKTSSYLKTDTRYPAAGTSKMEAYNFNETNTADVLVFYSKIADSGSDGGTSWDPATGDDISSGWTNNLMVIEKTAMAQTATGEDAVKVYGYGKKGSVSYLMLESFAALREVALKPGNIIAFDAVDGQITGLKLLHKPTDTEYKFENKYGFNNKDGVSFGRVITCEDNFILMRGTRLESEVPTEREQVYTVTDVVIYNKEDNKARKGSVNDLLGEKDFGVNATDAFIYTNYGVSGLIIIYE